MDTLFRQDMVQNASHDIEETVFEISCMNMENGEQSWISRKVI